MTETRALRILLGTGDRALEARLADGLPAAGIAVAGRALDAATLLDRLAPDRARDVDALVVSAGLHGLREAVMTALRERGTPVLLLVDGDAEAARFGDRVPALLSSSSAGAVAEAVRRLVAAPVEASMPAGGEAPHSGERAEMRGAVIAVTSGKAAPGKTAVAISLAAALGRRGLSVALVDADRRGGNVAPSLDLDPRRGLVGIAVTAGSLDERIDAELQPGPSCSVLTGLERPELTREVTADLLVATVVLLRARFGRVVVDLGAPPDPALVALADEVVLVTGADTVSAWNTRVALRAMGEGGQRRWSLLVNRRDRHTEYDAERFTRAFGIPVIGTVREDRRAAATAIESRRPLLDAGGRVARDLLRAAAELEARLAAHATGDPADDGAVTPVLAEPVRW